MTTTKSRLLVLLTSVWLIATAAFATRVAFAWDQQRKIPHQALATVPFDQETGNIALALSQGNGFANLFRKPTGPTAWLAPAYPVLLFVVFRVFGAMTVAGFFGAVLLNALFSAAATFPLFAVARRVGGLGIATATGWAWVFLPAGVLMPFEWIWDTSLSVLLVVGLVWLTLRVSESAGASEWIAYGLLWALALLTNPAIGAGLPFLLGWAVARAPRSAHVSGARPVLAVAVIILCCLPWTVRNYRQFHRVIPVRSSLPFELWIGNNDIFDPHAVHGIQRITRYEETHRYSELGESGYLREKREKALAFIRQNPALFLRLTLRRIVATWAGSEHPYDDFLQTDLTLARVVLVLNLVLMLGAIAGGVLLFLRRNVLAFPVAVFPVFYPLIYYVTHTSLRYRHPIDPLLVLLTVFAVACCFPRAASTGDRQAVSS
jgi:MFS family permease